MAGWRVTRTCRAHALPSPGSYALGREASAARRPSRHRRLCTLCICTSKCGHRAPLLESSSLGLHSGILEDAAPRKRPRTLPRHSLPHVPIAHALLSAVHLVYHLELSHLHILQWPTCSASLRQKGAQPVTELSFSVVGVHFSWHNPPLARRHSKHPLKARRIAHWRKPRLVLS